MIYDIHAISAPMPFPSHRKSHGICGAADEEVEQ